MTKVSNYVRPGAAARTWPSTPGSTATIPASQVTYDNGSSGLTADDAQAAIDELQTEIGALAAPALDDLSDVYVPSPADGDVLTYNDYLNEWEAAAPAGGGTLDGLTDVVITSVSDGDVLTYDSGSGDWVNAASSGAADILDIPTAETDTSLVLAPDGAGGVEWVTPTGGAGALVLLEQHTASNSTSLDFTTAISSTYDDYRIEFLNILGVSNAALWMRMGTGAGPTWDGSGGHYSGFNRRTNPAGAADEAATSQNQIWVSSNDGNSTILSTATNFGFSASIDLFTPGYPRITGQAYYMIPYSGGIRQRMEIVGAYESATALTGVQFLMSTGNISSGTIRIYGVAKS